MTFGVDHIYLTLPREVLGFLPSEVSHMIWNGRGIFEHSTKVFSYLTVLNSALITPSVAMSFKLEIIGRDLVNGNHFVQIFEKLTSCSL